MDDVRLTRRASLTGLLGGVVALAGWKAASSEAAGGPAAVSSGQVTCVLTPELTEGPFKGAAVDIWHADAGGVYSGFRDVVHTGQLFFNDGVTDAVYRRSPYSKRPNRTTRNAADSIYVNGGSKSLVRSSSVARATPAR
jgi:hypothetical protein